MALTKSTTDLAVIAKLGDKPNQDNGFTAAQMKAKYDEGPKALQVEVNAICDEVDALVTVIDDNLVTHKASNDHDGRYYTEAELNAGQLDTRYFTETELNGGQLDTRYYTEVELNAGQLNNQYYTETELNAGQLNNLYYTETELNAGQLNNLYYTETEADAKFDTIANITSSRKLSATGDFIGTLNGMPIVAAEPGLSTEVVNARGGYTVLNDRLVAVGIDIKTISGITGLGVANDATALNTWITSIGTTKVDLIVTSGTYLISTNVVFPANVNIIFMHGGIFKVSNTFSITGTNTKLECGLWQCFDLSLGGSIGGGWDVGEVYPEWFGAKRDGVTNDTLPLQTALNVGLPVKLASGTYLYTPPLIISIDGISVKGVGRNKSVLKPTLIAYNALEIGTTVSVTNIVLEDFQVYGNSTCTNGIVIGKQSELFQGSFIELNRVYVREFKGVGSAGLSIDRCWFFTCMNSFFNANYNNICLPDGAVTTTLLFGGYTEISRATNAGFYSTGITQEQEAIKFNHVSFEHNVRAMDVSKEETVIYLDTCYFELNQSDIRFIGTSTQYKHSMLFMDKCRTSATTSGNYTLELDYIKSSVIQNCRGYGYSIPNTAPTEYDIKTTENCEITFKNMRGTTAIAFITVAKALLGRISVTDYQSSSGKFVNYVSNDHYFDQHIHTTQTTAPTVSVNANAGVGATIELATDSTDTAGQIQITFGSSGWDIGVQCSLVFNKVYSGTPFVIITPASLKAADLAMGGISVNLVSSTGFSLDLRTASPAAGTALFNYVVIG